MSSEIDRVVEMLKKGPPPGSDWYWTYNLPLQAFARDDGSVDYLNYMPRRESCTQPDESIPKEQRREFFTTAAEKLENLAKLMRLFADGKIDNVYYHDEDPDKAVADANAKRAAKDNR